MVVAPLAGAWIETNIESVEKLTEEGRSSRRGVDWNKFTGLNNIDYLDVAPLAGAWIETLPSFRTP